MATSTKQDTAYSLPAFHQRRLTSISRERVQRSIQTMRSDERLLVAASRHSRDFQMLSVAVYEGARDQRMQIPKHLYEVQAYVEA